MFKSVECSLVGWLGHSIHVWSFEELSLVPLQLKDPLVLFFKPYAA